MSGEGGPPPRKRREIEPIGDSAADQILQEQIDSSKFAREEMRRLLDVFYILNGVVIALTTVIWIVEERAAGCDPHARIVTEHVLLALIAASAAQLGVLAASMGGALSRLTSISKP